VYSRKGVVQLVDESVTIVVEWENVILAGESRAKKMLEIVINQANQQDSCKEIIICANTKQSILEEPPIDLRSDILWRYMNFDGQHYYQLKNSGTSYANGSIIVFVDSDVIPEAGWLTNILKPFGAAEVQISCGKAYIEQSNIYSKAFALFWFFPVPAKTITGDSNTCLPKTTTHFFANNIAMKRKTAVEYPFPTSVNTSRGACLALAENLVSTGISLYASDDAIVRHPAPLPGRNFVDRGLAQGRDRYERSKGLSKSFPGSIIRFTINNMRGVVKILWFRGRVSLDMWRIPEAIVICLAFYTLYLFGEVGCMLGVKYIREIRV